MTKVEVSELSPGMIVAENVYDPATKKLLMKNNTKLTDKLINSLKSRNITEVPIAERYTLFIDPMDTTKRELKELLEDEINRLVPPKPEANPTDEVPKIAEQAINIVNEIVEDEILLEFCVQMRINDKEFLYKHGICTCALSLITAGAMGLNKQEMKKVGIAALVHDIGLSEMPNLVRQKNKKLSRRSIMERTCKIWVLFCKRKRLKS